MTSGLLPTVLQVLALLVFGGVSLGAFAWRSRRRRDFTHGVRGQAAVVDVRPTSALQRRSAVEAPTETVVVATAQVPRGVATDQKFPKGSFRVGEVVPVVQRPGDPFRLYVDVPGQAPTAFAAYGYLAGVLGALVGIVVVATGALGR